MMTGTCRARSRAREMLIEVLIYHWRKDITSCGCGWAVLGRSHPEHVANVYEQSVLAACERRVQHVHDFTYAEHWDPLEGDWRECECGATDRGRPPR